MIKLGSIARKVRAKEGLNQRQAAECLGISVVHLCNIENDKASPSAELLARYRELWGVDLYVLAWCLYGDVNRLPPAVQKYTSRLADAWRKQYGIDILTAGKDASKCSKSEI